MGAFAFFKAAINIRIPANEHPGPAISKIQSNIDELSGAGLSLPAPMRTLIVLGAAPSRYDAVIQLALSQKEIKDLMVASVQEALVTSWEQSKNKGQLSAQKISAIKQKKDNPSFSQQQRPEGSSSTGKKEWDDKGKGKAKGFTPRGKCSGKSHSKPHSHKHDEVAEMHITDTVSIPAPMTSTIVELAPSGSRTRKVAVPAPNKGKKRAHDDWLGQALQLTKDLDVAGTLETIRTLKEVVSNAHIEEVPSDTKSHTSKRSKHGDINMADCIDKVMNNEYISEDDNFRDAEERSIIWASDPEDMDDHDAELNGMIAQATGLVPPIVDHSFQNPITGSSAAWSHIMATTTGEMSTSLNFLTLSK